MQFVYFSRKYSLCDMDIRKQDRCLYSNKGKRLDVEKGVLEWQPRKDASMHSAY